MPLIRTQDSDEQLRIASCDAIETDQKLSPFGDPVGGMVDLGR